MAVTICALVPEEWGRLQHPEQGRGYSKKGDSVNKGMRRVRLAPEAGCSPEWAGAYRQGSHSTHRLTSSLTHSLQKQGGALIGNGGSPLRCQEDDLHEGTLGSGHGEES